MTGMGISFIALGILMLMLVAVCIPRLVPTMIAVVLAVYCFIMAVSLL